MTAKETEIQSFIGIAKDAFPKLSIKRYKNVKNKENCFELLCSKYSLWTIFAEVKKILKAIEMWFYQREERISND